MSELRRMLPSSNALFVFDAAARNGSFTAAAAGLNVTEPAVSRMLGRFKQYLGVRLFDRTAAGAILTEEGELLYRRVLEGFRSIESGLIEIERTRRGTETVTLSLQRRRGDEGSHVADLQPRLSGCGYRNEGARWEHDHQIGRHA